MAASGSSIPENIAGFKALDALRAVLDSGLDAHAKLVAAVLIRHGGDSGECYPSLPRIMAQSSLSRSAVKRAIRTLETAGVVAVTRHWGAINRYRVLVEPSISENRGSDGTSTGFPQNPGRFPQNPPLGSDRTPEMPIRNAQLNAQGNAHPVGARKRRAREETDPRVHPVLQAFHEAYVGRVGKEPTKTVLDWGRDGKRIRELPADYTTDDLTGAVTRFFDAPGYLSRNLRFADFIAALPRLLAGEPKAGRPRRVRYVEGEQQRDYSDYFYNGEEG